MNGVPKIHYFFDENLTRAERVNKQEQEILTIIKDHIDKYGHSPSVREIVKKSSLRSNSTVMNYLKRLREKEIIEWKPMSPRTIRILEIAHP